MPSLLNEFESILSEYNTIILPLYNKCQILFDAGGNESDDMKVLFNKIINKKLEHFKRLVYLYDYALELDISYDRDFTYFTQRINEISKHVLDNDRADRIFYGWGYVTYVHAQYQTVLSCIRSVIKEII